MSKIKRIFVTLLMGLMCTEHVLAEDSLITVLSPRVEHLIVEGLDERVARRGTEQVADPDIDVIANWTLGPGWTDGSGSASKSTNGTGTLVPNPQIPATVGLTYEIIFVVSNLVAGSEVVLQYGGVNNKAITANDTYTTYVTANAAGGLVFTPNATGDRFDIESVSIRSFALNTGAFIIDGHLTLRGPIYSPDGTRTVVLKDGTVIIGGCTNATSNVKLDICSDEENITRSYSTGGSSWYRNQRPSDTYRVGYVWATLGTVNFMMGIDTGTSSIIKIGDDLFANDYWELDTSGNGIYYGTLQAKESVSILSGSRTLTSAEMRSGSVFITGAYEAELPDECDSATGAQVTLAASSANVFETAVLDPADSIRYNGLSLNADDELDSDGTAFSSITFTCVLANTWLATAPVGSFVDGGPAD